METSAANKIKPDLSNLDTILREYDSWMNGYEKNLKVDMKTYSKANSEQAGWLAYYSEIHDELDVMFKDMETRVKVARASAAHKIEKVSSKKYTEKEMSRIEDGDPIVIATLKACREIEERKKKFETVVAAFSQRGYTLNNMTRIRMGGFQDESMYINED
jgi:hypothetical protein